MIEVLSTPDAEEHWHIARRLWRLQASAFRQLREAIECSESRTSWAYPFLDIKQSFPFAWDIEIPISQITSEEDRDQRELLIALATLTAGVAVQVDEDKLTPLLSRPVLRRLVGFTQPEIDRNTWKWLNFDEWFAPVPYGDRNHEDEEDRALAGYGSEKEFKAALWFWISPHYIDPVNRESYFVLSVGLPWRVESGTEPPQDWAGGERAALWSTVDRFFDELLKVSDLATVPETVGTAVENSETTGAGFERFEAAASNHQGVPYIHKARPRLIDATVLRKVPEYARGSRGPELAITDGSGQLNLSAKMQVLATMAHPNDEQSRQEVLARMELEVASQLAGALVEEGFDSSFIEENWNAVLYQAQTDLGWLSPEVLRTGNSAPPFDATICRMRGQVPGGVTAGLMLLYLLSCAEHHRRHMSVKRAAYVMSQASIASVDTDANYGISTILDCWSTYRPVSHLWAAFLVEPVFEDHQGFVQLLSTSEAIRRLGETNFARATKDRHGPLLDPSKTWRCPRQLKLPVATLEIPPLPSRTLEFLKSYRPR